MFSRLSYFTLAFCFARVRSNEEQVTMLYKLDLNRIKIKISFRIDARYYVLRYREWCLKIGDDEQGLLLVILSASLQSMIEPIMRLYVFISTSITYLFVLDKALKLTIL
jgi:hypothetical protein